MKRLVTMFFLASTLLFSKDYYIGDKISLKINKQIDEKQIENAFKNFKILKKIKDKNGDTIITFTSLTPGENILQIGDKEILIPIKSSIGEKDIKIYNKLADKKNRYDYNFFSEKNIIILTSCIFSLLLGIFFWYEDRKKNAYLNFKISMKKVNSENWREDISYYLRRYIDKTFNSNFLGGDYIENGLIDKKDIEFLKELDKLKFMPNSLEKYEEVKEKAFKFARKIEGGKKNVCI